MRPWGCRTCDQTFSTENGRNSHCRAKRHQIPCCEPCNMHFATEAAYREHCQYAAAHRTCNICKVTCRTFERYEKHLDKVHGTTNTVTYCNPCSRGFKSPSAYVQHIESGVHGVTRHQITHAVHTLRVVPQNTIVPATSRIEPYKQYADLEGHPFVQENNPVEATGEPEVEVAPDLPLCYDELQVSLAPQPAAPIVINQGYLYFPDDSINLGIPYACPICHKTFRNAFALTAHMNSPVHDPDAFMCPKCNRHFALVSGLIQHLESETCKLTCQAEIYTQFARLVARFSRRLM